MQSTNSALEKDNTVANSSCKSFFSVCVLRVIGTFNGSVETYKIKKVGNKCQKLAQTFEVQ